MSQSEIHNSRKHYNNLILEQLMIYVNQENHDCLRFQQILFILGITNDIKYDVKTSSWSIDDKFNEEPIVTYNKVIENINKLNSSK